MGFIDRLQHAWDVFINKDPTDEYQRGFDPGPMYSSRPDRVYVTNFSDRTIISALYNRVALDVAAIKLQHAKLDNDERYISTVKDGLNECLTLSANKDQTGRAFVQDVVLTMFDEGTVAIVPTKTNIDPAKSSSYEIEELRAGKIVAWYPDFVKVSLYNDRIGQRQEILFPKKLVAIVENPLYSVMNEPNSTLKRLTRKMSILDMIDEQSGSGKLDLIIQLPYPVRGEVKREQAEMRRKDIEEQIGNSKYGIAYIDATEHITQLNRSVENNLLKTIEYLTGLLYNQLGLTEDVFKGTANEETMLNYYNRTIEPILAAIADEMKRKFLTKTARTQGHSIVFYRNAFGLTPVNKIAEMADVLSRNEILSSNEVRQLLGFKPADDPNADKLRNSNMPHDDEVVEDENLVDDFDYEGQYNQNVSDLDDLDAQLDELERSLDA